jgi:hypothetical protein
MTGEWYINVSDKVPSSSTGSPILRGDWLVVRRHVKMAMAPE